MNSIIDALFYPVFIGAIIGIVCFLYDYRNNYFLIFSTIGTLLILISWRIIINIVSSRYAIILIWPAMFFTAYCLCSLYKKTYSLPHKQRHFIKSLIIVIGCVIFATLLGKTFHLNPYRTVLQDAGNIIAQDCPERTTGLLLDYSNDASRLSFFSDKEVFLAYPEIKLSTFDIDILPFENTNTTAYIICEFESETEQQQVARMLPPRAELLFKSYRNKKKKKYITVWKLPPQFYTPVTEYVQENNIFRNSSLHQYQPLDIHDQRIIELQQRGHYFSNILPENWNMLATRGWRNGAQGKFVYNNIDQNSPFFDLSSQERVILYSQDLYPAGNYKFSFKAKLMPGTLLAISLITYPTVQRYKDDYPRIAIFAGSGHEEEYSVYIDKLTLIDADKFRICLDLLHGSARFYSFALFPENLHKEKASK